MIRIKKSRIYSLIILCVILLLLTSCISDSSGQLSEDSIVQDLYVHVIDVGQADSILLTSLDKAMLIDCGDTDDKETIINYLKELDIKKIDYLILTHPHKDHIGSAVDIIRSFDIGKIYMSSITTTTKTFENLLDTIDEKQIDTVLPLPGEKFNFGKCDVEVIGPVKEYSDINNNSLVLKVENGKNTFLFTGDMEKESEKDIMNSGYNDKVDVLKVAHHGSDGSSTLEFLNILKPSVSIISCGVGNDYGHPHKELLDRLKEIKTTILRTDKEGTVVIKSDGNSIFIVDNIKNKDSEEITSEKESLDKEASASTNNKVYIGNKKTKKFHLESCNSLPAENNRVYFDTPEEAIKSGYEPCGRCKP